jgi:hypothetical protein
MPLKTEMAVVVDTLAPEVIPALSSNPQKLRTTRRSVCREVPRNSEGDFLDAYAIF